MGMPLADAQCGLDAVGVSLSLSQVYTALSCHFSYS